MDALSGLTFPSGLRQIEGRYDAILCDVWGVIHNGRRVFEPACEALKAFRALGKPVVLISNAPVPAAQVMETFQRVGGDPAVCDAMVTSGDATRAALAERAPGPVWRLGVDEGFEHDHKLYEGLDLDFVEPEAAAFGLLIGMRDQANDHPEDYREELRPLAARGLPMICANPDIQVRVGDRLWWCAGAIAKVYEDLGGPVIYPGKPHAPIYDLAFSELARLTGAPVDRARVLAIGDGPGTDLKGAAAQGLDALYVGTGLRMAGGDFEADTRAHLSEKGARARYAQAMLTW